MAIFNNIVNLIFLYWEVLLNYSMMQYRLIKRGPSIYFHLMKPLCLILLFSSLGVATTDKKIEYTYMDELHEDISHKIVDWVDIIDSNIISWLSNNENTTVCEAEPFLTNPNIVDSIESIDSFFQNERYLNETRDIYVRLRLRNDFYSREPNRVKVKVSARLPFDECKKQWNIYLEDARSNNAEIQSTDSSSGGIGVSYLEKDTYGIDASYSIGLQGGYPYIRARYRLPIEFDTWEVEPAQTFKYSTKFYFEEETNVYFDKFLDKNNLLRIQLHRETASTEKGTDYGLILKYYWNLEEDGKLEFTQSFFGNTYYNDFYELDENYSGINNYVTSLSWRQNIWRDWFYYEIKPSVNYHKDYNYEPSYFIRLNFDFYFGTFTK